MSQIASNSIPGNKSPSIFVFMLIFSDVVRPTLGIPAAAEFPPEFDNVKEIVKPETSSYWGLGDMISYGVQSVQSVIKYVIGVEDRPREFYVVHIKDEKNPENNKDVLRERGREGKEYDIPLKGGKLPGNSLIVNAENPITEYVSSPEKTVPATNNAPDKRIPMITDGKSRNANGASAPPTPNGERDNSRAANLPPSENEEITPPSSSADPQNLSQKKDDERVTHPNHESEIGTPKEVPIIANSENARLDQEGNSNGVHDHARINPSPTAQTSNPQSASVVNSSNGDVSKSARNQGENLISNHHAAPAIQLAVSQTETVGHRPSREDPSSTQVGGGLQNLGNRLATTNVENAEPSLPIKKETQSSEYNGLSDARRNSHSNLAVDDDVTPPQEPTPPTTSQRTNSNRSSSGNSESDIPPVILEPLANRIAKRNFPKDDEFPRRQQQHEGSPNDDDHNVGPSSQRGENTRPTAIPVKIDSHVPEPTQHEIQEPPSSDPTESMPTDECEMEYAKELCQKHPADICEQFRTDEEFDDYVKKNSGCAADGREKVPPFAKLNEEPDDLAEPHYDPNELISANECEIEFEKELCQREPDTCERFQTGEEFIAYVKENSGCEAGGRQKTPTDDSDHSVLEPSSSSFDPNELISLNECETEFERELCNSEPDVCRQFRSDKEFVYYVKKNSGCEAEAGGQENGGRHSLGHDVDEDPSRPGYRSHDTKPLENFDRQDVPDYDNDALSTPQFKPAASSEKKKSGTKKKSKSSEEKRSKRTYLPKS